MLAMAGRGMAQGGFQRSGLKSLLRGEPMASLRASFFLLARSVLRRGGNPPAPAFPGGETGKGRSDSVRRRLFVRKRSISPPQPDRLGFSFT
jgi:hypothetical protein